MKVKTYYQPLAGFFIGGLLPTVFGAKNPIIYAGSAMIGMFIGLRIANKKAKAFLDAVQSTDRQKAVYVGDSGVYTR